ncbi:MAG: carbon monoxide dehydrogenase, partial [Desulfobacterales bacterium]
MAEKKETQAPKAKKLADPVAATIDPASQQMIQRAHDLGVETAFDRAVTLKPCNIGSQGICCKNCGMGPCRLPLPKSGIEGEDTRKGICGATPNTIAARNFIRMIAGGAAAHSDHGRSVAEVFMAAARKETDAYKIKDTKKLIEVAQVLGVDTTVEVDGEQLDRDLDEIAVEVGEKALNEWGKAEGELLFAKRAPEPRYEIWKKQGVLPRNIDREIVEIMHRTHIGVDQDYKNLMKQGTRAAIADGWGGSMLATELQDILFGTPYPLASEANLGVMKENMVNIVIHGHEPVLSEMIVAVAQKKEMHDYAVSKGAKGIQLSGICCTANEILQRHGVPLCGTFLQQELAIITGACDAMVVDIQCIFQNLANVAKCFHTKLITTHPIARMEQDNVIHIEFDEHHALEDAERIVKLAIDNFE